MDFLKKMLSENEQTEQTVQDVTSLVKNAKISNVNQQDVRGFALENDDGSLVKVFVRVDQAEEFEQALANALYAAEEEGIEIPEVLFDLRKNFDIVDVVWGEKSIPEDEEETEKQLETKPKTDSEEEPLDSPEEDIDFKDGFGKGDNSEGEDLAGLDLSPDVGGESSQQQDLISAITKVMDMLKSEAEAKQEEAKARRAEAEAKIAQETNKAASLRASQEEEILDMEDYNKKQAEDKKNADTREKLIKYRHDLKSDTKLGESMNTQVQSKKYPDATPEEEEILDMERWEEKEKQNKQDKTLRDRLIRYRNAKKHGEKKEEQPSHDSFKDAVRGMSTESIEKIRGITFSKFNTLVESQLHPEKK